MKTLIAYRSKYGTTAACARALAGKVGGGAALADLADARDVNVSEYDVVLIGGSIYGGKIQRQVVAFAERNRGALLQKRVGLFLCCLSRGEEALVQLQSAFPDWLLAHCPARALPGGEIHYDALTFFDRLLLRRLSHLSGDLKRLRLETLDELAAAVTSAR